MEDVTKLKISNVEKERLLIKNLNNRPNAMATYGQAKMSSTEAKDIFDKQFEFLTERFNNMADSVAAVDNKLDEQDKKLESGAFIPKKGVDYYTPDDIKDFEAIIAAKASNLGGFIPISPAPLFESGADVNNTTAKVTSVTNNGGVHIVQFNNTPEEMVDGGFETYKNSESVVPLFSFSKGNNGWSGLNFGVENTGIARCAKVYSDPSGSHSGVNYIEVWGRYSSLCKSLKLKPYTNYTLSFWQKGTHGSYFDNISVAAKAYDGDVIYQNVGGALRCDFNNPKYQVLYNRGTPNLSDAVIESTGVWQKFEIHFNTLSNEYVDIFIYFGDNSWQPLFFDDFSIKEDIGEEFIAVYEAGVDVPSEVAAGSVFYVERDNGRVFTRFEYASSVAIQKVYDYVESLSGAIYKKLENDVGDISTALDNITALQNSLIGGENK